jgi:hypothetical protein
LTPEEKENEAFVDEYIEYLFRDAATKATDACMNQLKRMSINKESVFSE